jgi:DNA-binding NtrC family response regulator
MKKYKIFVVEDDEWYGEMISYHLSLNPDFFVTHYKFGNECLKNLHQKPDLITVDLSLPDMTGRMLYKKIRELLPNTSVIILSGQEDISEAISLLKEGVQDYIVKDKGAKDLLWNSIARIRETNSLRAEVEELKLEISEKFRVQNCLIGQSEAVKKVVTLMDKAVRSDINVSITGETGTGKEVVARCIHYNSGRKKGKFVPVNMAAIPKELLESELFGHEKGAFTGAVARKIGRFEEANGGTIFLDEIAELDFSIQSKLLRVLQERELTKVGGIEVIKLDIRLIVATHKNLTEEVRNKTFREDLFYRIMGLTIEIPPLRYRGNDIILLADHFLENFLYKNKLPKVKFNKGAKKRLIEYHYPGNVRELKAIVELAVVICDGNEIIDKDIIFNSNISETSHTQEIKTLRQHICDIVQYHLTMNGNDIKYTANMLDIGVSTIYKMIKSGEIRQNDKLH